MYEGKDGKGQGLNKGVGKGQDSRGAWEAFERGLGPRWTSNLRGVRNVEELDGSRIEPIPNLGTRGPW